MDVVHVHVIRFYGGFWLTSLAPFRICHFLTQFSEIVPNTIKWIVKVISVYGYTNSFLEYYLNTSSSRTCSKVFKNVTNLYQTFTVSCFSPKEQHRKCVVQNCNILLFLRCLILSCAWKSSRYSFQALSDTNKNNRFCTSITQFEHYRNVWVRFFLPNFNRF